MEKQIEINGVNFNYSVEGEGIPVVLMHGWGCNRTTLASIEKLLVPYFKVYNVDFPGFGKSTEPQTVWGIEDYTRLTEEFLKKENIENPILLGHSFGGHQGLHLQNGETRPAAASWQNKGRGNAQPLPQTRGVERLFKRIGAYAPDSEQGGQ